MNDAFHARTARHRVASADGIGPESPGCVDLDRLKSHNAFLLTLAERLARLADDLYAGTQSDQARRLAADIRILLSVHLDEEACALQIMERQDAPVLAELIERATTEHDMLRKLIHPVLGGLRAVGRGYFPTRPCRFVFSIHVLCEFIRLHANFKSRALYPLLTGSALPDLAPEVLPGFIAVEAPLARSTEQRFRTDRR